MKNEKADKLFLGNFITMDEVDPYAKALTVKDNKIQYVGSVETAKLLCDKNTKVIDYGENFIYPGFIETHCHPDLAGWRLVGQINLTDGDSYKDYQDIIKKYIKEHPGRDYYFGGGWRVIDSIFPTKKLLDEVCPDIPIAIQSSDGHSVLINSKAIEILGATEEILEKYPKGEIKYDEDGEPTGLVSEKPAHDILLEIQPTMTELKEFFLAWQEFAFKNGYTATAYAGNTLLIKNNTDAAFLELAKEKKLKLRTYPFWHIEPNVKNVKAAVKEAAKFKEENDNEYYSFVGFKILLDGVVEAHTAWLIEDYADEPGYHGVEGFNDHDKIVELIKTASEYGLSVHAHSIGNGATKFMLDCIEDSVAVTKDMDQRNAICHLQQVRDEDIQRFADYNVVAIVAPLWTPINTEGSGEAFEQECNFIGKKNADKSYPIKSFFDAGALTVFHSDYPVSPLINVPYSIYTAVTRKYPGPDKIRGAKERITQKQALLAMTKYPAHFLKVDDKLGTLEVGKIANMTVYNKDFINDDIEHIAKSKLVATVVDGEEVYKA